MHRTTIELHASRFLFLLAALALAAPASALAQDSQVGILVVTCSEVCRVSVDGQAVGEGPVVVRDLVPGEHLVQAVGSGGNRFQGLASVVAGRSNAFAAELGPPSAAVTPAPAPVAGATQPAGATEAVGPTAALPSLHTPASLARTRTTDRGRGELLTPRPERYDGGIRERFKSAMVPLLVVGAVLAAGGVVFTPIGYARAIDSTEYFITDGDLRSFLQWIGPAAITLGVSMAAIGIILGIFGAPGAAEDSGVVPFANVQPWMSPQQDGLTAGVSAQW